MGVKDVGVMDVVVIAAMISTGGFSLYEVIQKPNLVVELNGRRDRGSGRYQML